MKHITKQQYLDAYDNAPGVIQENMNDPRMGSIIRKIGNQYSMTEEQILMFAREIGLVQLGFTAKNEFASVLNEKFELGRRESSDIADQVNKIFFKPFEKILNTYEVNKNKQTKVETPDNKTKSKESPIARLNKEKQKRSTTKKPEVNAAQLAQSMMDTYDIHIDQAGAIQTLIQQTIDGEIRSKEFTNQLKKEIGVSDETAQKIASDINERVFEPIHRAFTQPDEYEEKAHSEQKIRPGEEDKYREPIEQDDLEIPDTPPPPDPNMHEQLNRDDVLREIEDQDPAPKSEQQTEETSGKNSEEKESGSGLIRDMFAEAKRDQKRQAGKSIVREKLAQSDQSKERSEQAPKQQESPQQNDKKKLETQENIAEVPTDTDDNKPQEKEEPPKRPEESFESKKNVANSDPYREPIG